MNPWKGLRGLPREVWLVCASTLVNRLGTMALPFLVLYLTEGRRWTPGEAGFGMMVYGAGALAAGPFSGRLADRLGHVQVLKASLWSSGTLLLLLPFATARPLLFALIFLWAGLTQAFWPSAMALLADLAPPEQRKAVYALHRLAVNLGMAVGPAVGGFIAHRSYTWVFWTDGLSTLAGALLLGLLLKTPPRPSPHHEQARGASPWRDRHLAFLLLPFVPLLMVFFQIEGTLPLWVVRDLDLGSRFYGLLFTVNTLIIVALEVSLNLAMARWPHGRQLFVGALCLAAGFGLTAWATGRTTLILTTVIWTFGEMILFPAMSDAVATLAPPDRRGEYMGLLSLCFAAGLALGPWLGVLAYAKAGPRAVWLSAFGVALGAGLLLARFRTPDGPRPPRDQPLQSAG
ncbi:MFS transporter [Geothrix oryzae]|uniref:MFS transporter n=1 Tax=Geothrix oryzae TaxID=2927975 RepID=A0ABN6UUR6_9BACT|nr:MFS transporter [Geothrix oryzae]BDU68504.1 MFS transporter [Geothrix oryzae]